MGKQERKYRMKSGSVIRIKGTNDYYSDANLTDEVAEKLLKVNPNRSQLFAKMPKDAMKKLKVTDPDAEAAAKAKAEAEKAAQEAFDKAKEAGELTYDQLNTLTIDKIKEYADAHKYAYESSAKKDDLVTQVSEKKPAQADS
ncbi:hypothetical protein [uncultured Christiangramia sp.]|uniref:hypothetical protein n=1 Tax=uncultured Christiangramia sp. TaxID=503836 RepID=UPI002637538D|nr:hypothetical protein [uncultured Christiangramia sp.]